MCSIISIHLFIITLGTLKKKKDGVTQDLFLKVPIAQGCDTQDSKKMWIPLEWKVLWWETTPSSSLTKGDILLQCNFELADPSNTPLWNLYTFSWLPRHCKNEVQIYPRGILMVTNIEKTWEKDMETLSVMSMVASWFITPLFIMPVIIRCPKPYMAHSQSTARGIPCHIWHNDSQWVKNQRFFHLRN